MNNSHTPYTSDRDLETWLEEDEAKLAFGELLKKYRSLRGMNQVELYRSLHPGKKRDRHATISAWENGDSLPSRATIQSIAQALRLTLRQETLLLYAAGQPTKRVPQTFVSQNPYKGLAPFTEQDHPFFFGREAFKEVVVDALLKAQQENTHRFLALSGPSGSGKTSFVQAGLMPALKKESSCKDWIYLETLKPGRNPLAALAKELSRHLPTQTVEQISLDLAKSPRGILSLVQQMNKGVVVTIDQGEELFTQVRDEHMRTLFFDLLVNASTDASGTVWVIFILRSDFASRFEEHGVFAQLMAHHQYRMPPMDGEDLRKVIEEPTKHSAVQLRFEDDLISIILVEMQGQVERLPLLQFTLALLFEKYRDQHRITKTAYYEMGGVRGALAKYAQQTYEELCSQVENAELLVKHLFMRLMVIDSQAHSSDTVTRRRAGLEEFKYLSDEETARMEKVIDTFVDRRLLQPDNTSGVPVLEVAHEILLQEWFLCRRWREECYEDIQQIQEINRDAFTWSKQQKRNARNAELYRGSKLKSAQSLKTRIKVSEREESFLHASKVHQRQLQFRWSAIILLAVISLSITAGIMSWPYLHPITLVTTLNDSGPGSLRQTIAQVPAGSTITFDTSLHGTIFLTSNSLNIAKDLTIRGPGAGILSISGGKSGHVVRLIPQITVTIFGLAFKDGQTSDSPIDNSGTLTLNNSVVSDNTTSGSGGGILNSGGSVTLNNSIVSNNTGKYGIANSGTLTLNNSIVSGNTAVDQGVGGGILNNLGGPLTLNNSIVSNNTGKYGSGIANSGTLTLNNSAVSGNTATCSGGGIENSGQLMLNNSSVSGNTSGCPGGGIDNTGQLMLNNSSVSGNKAQFGGGGIFYSGGFGGVDNRGETFTLNNSTISSNTATGGPGGGVGIDIFAPQSKRPLPPLQVTLLFCTIYGNTSDDGGGLWIRNPDEHNNQVTVAASIIAGNSAHTGSDVAGPLTTLGYNLIGNGSGATFLGLPKWQSTDLSGVSLTNLKIDPLLRDNGGSTKPHTLTHALFPNSPALDAIPLQDCQIKGIFNSPSRVYTDQRGMRRPDGNESACDIGAFEYTDVLT